MLQKLPEIILFRISILILKFYQEFLIKNYIFQLNLL